MAETIKAISRQPEITEGTQNSQYRVTLGNYPLLEWFCVAVNLPDISIQRFAQPTRLATIAKVGDSITFGDLSFTFLVDEKLRNYQEIFDWMVNIGFPSNHNQFMAKPRADSIDRDGDLNLYSDLTVTIMTNKNNPAVRLRYYEAWPVTLGGLTYTTQSTDAEYLTADVTFAFSYYEFENL